MSAVWPAARVARERSECGRARGRAAIVPIACPPLRSIARGGDGERGDEARAHRTEPQRTATADAPHAATRHAARVERAERDSWKDLGYIFSSFAHNAYEVAQAPVPRQWRRDPHRRPPESETSDETVPRTTTTDEIRDEKRPPRSLPHTARPRRTAGRNAPNHTKYMHAVHMCGHAPRGAAPPRHAPPSTERRAHTTQFTAPPTAGRATSTSMRSRSRRTGLPQKRPHLRVTSAHRDALYSASRPECGSAHIQTDKPHTTHHTPTCNEKSSSCHTPFATPRPTTHCTSQTHQLVHRPCRARTPWCPRRWARAARPAHHGAILAWRVPR